MSVVTFCFIFANPFVVRLMVDFVVRPMIARAHILYGLDKSWGCLKAFIPNSVTTKDGTSGFLNGDIWDYVYPMAMAAKQP